MIQSKCGLHWILQSRKSLTRWESIGFCATREGLLLRIKEHLKGRKILPLDVLVKHDCDPKARAIIEALPPYYPKQGAS